MKNKTLFLIFTSLALVLSAVKVISAEQPLQAMDSVQSDPSRSVAWYVANVKEARAKNQQCFDNPDIKNSEDCENALHALQISFKGGN